MEAVTNFYSRMRAKAEENPKKTTIWGLLLLLLILSFLVPSEPPHVSLSGEPLFPNGPSWFTNTILTTLIIDLLIILVAFLATRGMKVIPGGLQNFVEMVIEYLYGLAESVAGKNAKEYFPWCATLFIFIVFCNYSGLIPGVGSLGLNHVDVAHEAPAHEEPADTESHDEESEEADDGHGMVLDGQLAMANGNLILLSPADVEPGPASAEEEGHGKFVPWFRAPSADLNVTFALALATMVMVQIYGFRALGGSYTRKFWNPSGEGAMKGINIFVGILELISEISRILTFAFRLFGNIFAGEIVLATMAFLIAFLIPLPFYFLELLVGAVQALVFMMLALVFFSMATISHGDEHH